MVAGNLEIGLGFLRLRGRCSKMPRLIVAKVTNAPESISIFDKTTGETPNIWPRRVLSCVKISSTL